MGDTAKIREDARELARTIWDNERIRALAENPLLLTTLLVVKRWIGELPRSRAALYREAIRVEPSRAIAHLNLGHALGRQGLENQAMSAFRRAIHLQPDLAEAHFSLGWMFKRQGRLDDAASEFRETLRIKPDHSGARDAMNALAEMGLSLKPD